MKIYTYDKGGNLEGTVTNLGGTLSGPLLLTGVVESPSEAVHKQYIDTIAENINAIGIATGTMSPSRMPSFDGDAVSTVGSTILTLKNSGVVTGDYTKVTVDSKGLVTSGGSLSESDIPEFSWNKITTGKPATLDGYGITDALSGINGTVINYITLNQDPVDPTDLSTKQYVDSNITFEDKLITGDIISNSIISTPTGFLKCNGGELLKTDYSALYSIIGDAFNIDTTPGSGQPWRQQYTFNLDQFEDITGWTTDTSLPGALGWSQAIVTKNRVYLVGGYNGSSFAATVYTAPINADGTLGAWTTGTSLPGVLSHSQSVVTKNRVYLLGGFNGSNSLSVVYTASINADGTLGAWSAGTSLPSGLYGTQVVVTKNRVYLLGGSSVGGDGVSTVYTAPINADGTLGAWTTGTSLPGALVRSQAVVTENRVYLLGGGTTNTNSISTVYTAPINADGTLGAWVIGTSLPEGIARSQVVVTKNRVYLLGGSNEVSSAISTVYTAPINSDGTLGAWSVGTSIPNILSWSQAIVTSSRVYLLGGSTDSASASISTVYTATFSGGMNNYMDIINVVPTSTDKFRLPDYTKYELFGLYYYIKS